MHVDRLRDVTATPATTPPIAADATRTPAFGRNQYRNVNATESIATGSHAPIGSLANGSAGSDPGRCAWSEEPNESATPPSSGATTRTAR
jgi:hypothetical protein